jgi:hypothetical protein
METKREDPKEQVGCIVVPAALWGLIMSSALTVALAIYLHWAGAYTGSDHQPNSKILFNLIEVTFLASLGCGIGATCVLVLFVALPRSQWRLAGFAVAAGFGAAASITSLGVFPTV